MLFVIKIHEFALQILLIKLGLEMKVVKITRHLPNQDIKADQKAVIIAVNTVQFF
jgi:hypothetical protein